MIDMYFDIIERVVIKKRKMKKRLKLKKKNLDLCIMLWKERVIKLKKKGCKGVFFKGNLLVFVVLKKILLLNIKVCDIFFSREDGMCVFKIMIV